MTAAVYRQPTFSVHFFDIEFIRKLIDRDSEGCIGSCSCRTTSDCHKFRPAILKPTKLVNSVHRKHDGQRIRPAHPSEVFVLSIATEDGFECSEALD